MRIAIISFILYVIYDTYMRNRENEKYITRAELEKYGVLKSEIQNLSESLGMLRKEFDNRQFA